VIRGEEFTTLLIALCFHQFFEGFALGATITDADFPSPLPVIFTVLWYSLTAPIGVAIGISISGSYSENAPATLLVQGILDAVSAGILIYTALVELMSYQITNNLVRSGGGGGGGGHPKFCSVVYVCVCTLCSP
jgi:zinc transporter 1/2/3